MFTWAKNHVGSTGLGASTQLVVGRKGFLTCLHMKSSLVRWRKMRKCADGHSFPEQDSRWGIKVRGASGLLWINKIRWKPVWTYHVEHTFMPLPGAFNLSWTSPHRYSLWPSSLPGHSAQDPTGHLRPHLSLPSPLIHHSLHILSWIPLGSLPSSLDLT